MARQEGTKTYYRQAIKHCINGTVKGFNVGDAMSVYTHTPRHWTARIVDFTFDATRTSDPYRVSLQWFYSSYEADSIGYKTPWQLRRISYFSDHVDYDMNHLGVIVTKVPIERYDTVDSIDDAKEGTVLVGKMLLIGKNVQAIELPAEVF